MSNPQTTENAILPYDLAGQNQSLRTMSFGRLVWVCPLALRHDSEGRLWLNNTVGVFNRMGPWWSLAVYRDEDGWHADAFHVGRDTTWSKLNILQTLLRPWIMVPVVTFRPMKEIFR